MSLLHKASNTDLTFVLNIRICVVLLTILDFLTLFNFFKMCLHLRVVMPSSYFTFLNFEKKILESIFS